MPATYQHNMVLISDEQNWNILEISKLPIDSYEGQTSNI